MQPKIYNKTNFHKHTFCIFKEIDVNVVKDLKLSYKSKSGSSYYFTETGVYRLSNHWGRAANCKWRLDKNSNIQTQNSNRTKLGFAHWNDFFPDNDIDKLYFIEVDYITKLVNFYHKQNINYSADKILRSATETTKLIKQIRTLLEETAWAKYLSTDNIDILRKEIIEKLINSNLSFNEIRKELI